MFKSISSIKSWIKEHEIHQLSSRANLVWIGSTVIDSKRIDTMLRSLWILCTVAAPLIAAASNQKMFFGQLGAAYIQERPLIKK